MIKRSIQNKIESKFFKGKAIIIIGARQVGKTTLLKMIADNFDGKSIYLNCDEPDIRAQLTDATSTKLNSLVGDHKLVLIDEAQRMKNIGITLKLFTDQLGSHQIIASGSSAFELSNEINEPLTGRKFEFDLYPISFKELADVYGKLETNRLLEERLIYGMYPEIIVTKDDKKNLLKSLTQSYLFKDILSYKGLKKPELLEKLLTALALQIGNQVSYKELAQLLKVDNETVGKYIELLEKAFVVFRLPPFSRNLRTELRKMRKIYFYDNGVRNVLINNFNLLNVRQDTGALWENYLISERIINNRNRGSDAKSYFWRTQQQQELDYIEIDENNISAFEFTWNPKTKKKIPKVFLDNYPDSKTEIVNKENYFSFLNV
ncbi:ATP-binding protein [Bacteroidota bacterium]